MSVSGLVIVPPKIGELMDKNMQNESQTGLVWGGKGLCNVETIN